MSSVTIGPKLWFMASGERPTEMVEKSAQRLRLIRAVLGLEQVEMAEACGVSSQRWSNWENEQHLPDVIVMSKAALLYGFTLDWIYRGVLERLPYEFVVEIQRRRPDLVLGAPRDAVASEDWDIAEHRKGRSRRRGAS